MSTKNCQTCPSFLTKEAADDFFHIEAPGAMCARFGHLLGISGGTKEAAVTARAEFCDGYGEDRPAEAEYGRLFGMGYAPRPDLISVPVAGAIKADSCDECVNFDESVSACAAFGKLIFPGRKVFEATSCSIARSGMPGGTVGEVLEVLTGPEATPVTLRPGKETKTSEVKQVNVVTNPGNYESDLPVEPKHEEMIRAWRKVETKTDPVYLPIFRTDFFGERAELIPDPDKPGASDPSLYVDHNGLLEKFAVMVYKKDMNLSLIGMPGVGKTLGMEYIAWQMNAPFTRIAYTEATDPDQVLGTYQYGPIPGSQHTVLTPLVVEEEVEEVDPVTGEKSVVLRHVTKMVEEERHDIGTYFQPGVLPINWQEPGILLSDEWNLPAEAIGQVYRSMNDSARQIIIGNHRFRRHDLCFHVGAINPHHDARNIGAKPVASADSQRWAFLELNAPTEEQMKHIICDTVMKLDGEVITASHPLGRGALEVMMKIGNDLRQMSLDNTLPDFWTLRQEIKVARLICDFGLMEAYRMAYLYFVDQNVRDLVESSIRSHTPYGVDWA